MLKGISPYLSPELLKTLYEMGHGDRLLLADAHFPAHELPQRVLRADGIDISQLLGGILPLVELEPVEDALQMLQPDSPDPQIHERAAAVAADFLAVTRRYSPKTAPPARLARKAFYEAARTSYAAVMTGELRIYGNLILIKGVTPVDWPSRQ